MTVVLFYPGAAPNGDTAGLYLYALGRLPIDDWHPTTNVVLNWFLLQVWENPASIVAFQSGLVWLGFGVSTRSRCTTSTACGPCPTS